MTRRAERPASDPRASTFEADMARLEAIVGQLQDEGVELDAALALFEEGVRRLRDVTGRLAEVEARVKLLTETDAGFELDDLDA